MTPRITHGRQHLTLDEAELRTLTDAASLGRKLRRLATSNRIKYLAMQLETDAADLLVFAASGRSVNVVEQEQV